eukprot:TRINITY_DN2875_c1_g1_i8.p1 TRINITY_DN2875_c1_g1~~TRINITY_DN2875_c1_g1_i8.p1  ORF type:complete len:353 (-),score=91.76 TRINITY_DN2875_c1_g1_i8:527-1585(-)
MLIENEDIYEVFEKSMFEGFCQVFDHYGKIGEDNVKFLMSLDENNLYGWAMTKPLPYGDFQLITNKQMCKDIYDVIVRVSNNERKKPYEDRYSTKFLHNDRIPKDLYAFTGYIRCSLFFTRAQKERLKDFPPLPSKIKPQDFFNRSRYMSEIREQLNLKESPTSKLVYGVFPLPDYSIYSEMLKYLLENDMVTLEKIHSVVLTPIGYVFRDFVIAMTKKRQEAANLVKEGKVVEGESLKEFAKLNVNSSFGKTIQDDANFDESFVIKTQEQFLKKTVKRKIIDYNVLAPVSDNFGGMIELKLKKKAYLIKSPRYLGCSIFWLSKMIVLDFVYNCLYKVYKPQVHWRGYANFL